VIFLSVGTLLNDLASERRKNLFLNKPLLSDIKFIVEGETFYAHKAIVTSRCEVMKAMFRVGFAEHSKKEVEIGECSAECFLAFLEYLYTGSFFIFFILNRILCKKTQKEKKLYWSVLSTVSMLLIFEQIIVLLKIIPILLEF
jgi:hypothetical protein